MSLKKIATAAAVAALTFSAAGTAQASTHGADRAVHRKINFDYDEDTIALGRVFVTAACVASRS